LLASDFEHILKALEFEQVTKDLSMRVAFLSQAVQQVASSLLLTVLSCASLKEIKLDGGYFQKFQIFTSTKTCLLWVSNASAI
jgi:hypothetical protein